MLNNELQIAKDTFNLPAIEQEERELMKLRGEFLSYFSVAKLHSLTIEEYVVGLQNTGSFAIGWKELCIV